MTTPTAVLWVDATHGAAGDMLLGALLDAGAPLARVTDALDSLARAGAEPVGVRVEQVRRHGLRAAKAVVTTPPSHVTRGPAQVAALVGAAGLAPAAAGFAHTVFAALAAAEARVHGVPEADIHFHEVGALDSLADVVGCAVALEALGALAGGAVRVVSRVGLGGGTAATAHGRMPVPVPATLELLARAGAPVHAGSGDREQCTPTGAALLATMATGWGDLPPLAIRAAGVGAGTADPPDRPNVVRVVVGDAVPVSGSGGRWRTEDLLVLEATVDDLDPRLWPDVLDRLVADGAADAWLTPVLMRHGRPGHVLTALVAPDRLDAVFATAVTATTTLGARVAAVTRRSLHRDRVEVEVSGQRVGVKRGLLDGRVVTAQPEWDEARAAADRLGRSTAEVLDAARAAAPAVPPAAPTG